MGHENFDRAAPLAVGSDRAFGILFTIVFGLLGTWLLLTGRSGAVVSGIVALAFAVAAAVKPQFLAPLNRLWMRFGALLHRIVSPLILAFMFYGVVTPTGWIMRAMGRDLLRLRRDRESATYWIEREPPGPAPDSLKDQF